MHSVLNCIAFFVLNRGFTSQLHSLGKLWIEASRKFKNRLCRICVFPFDIVAVQPHRNFVLNEVQNVRIDIQEVFCHLKRKPMCSVTRE